MTHETLIADIKATVSQIRQARNELFDGNPTHCRQVRLSDKIWDLEARYKTLCRIYDEKFPTAGA